jgi:hypothetical protein
MERTEIKLCNPQQAHKEIMELWPLIKSHLMSGTQLVLEVRGQKRTADQNKMLHSILKDLSEQVEWFGKRLTSDGWKIMLTGHLAGVELVPNLDKNGFVSLTRGNSTSKMTRKEMSDLFELAWSFGNENGVKWSPTSQGRLIHDP